jgi:pyridoxine 5-phosphate synthase
MTKLSVNINKFATLETVAEVIIQVFLKAALDAERIWSRRCNDASKPDERHIRYSDVREIKGAIEDRVHIEGNPREQKFRRPCA